MDSKRRLNAEITSLTKRNDEMKKQMEAEKIQAHNNLMRQLDDHRRHNQECINALETTIKTLEQQLKDV